MAFALAKALGKELQPSLFSQSDAQELRGLFAESLRTGRVTWLASTALSAPTPALGITLSSPWYNLLKP